LLDILQRQDFSSSNEKSTAQLTAELLSDTLDMLLLYRHESQISTYQIKAARLLFEGLSQTPQHSL
jgi:hypothetical protein